MLQARKNAKTAVNLTMVYAYYEIGRIIVEEEQRGERRAAYGQQLLKGLSDYLTQNFGKGFSVGNLKNIRQFYKVYSADQIGETVFSQFKDLPSINTGRKFYLSWSHYLKLMRIEDVDERHFYEIEAVKNDWSLRELERQFDSALYHRILLSTDKDKIQRLSVEGQIIEKSSDLVKDPYVLEFLVFYNRMLRCFVLFDLKIGSLKHQDLGQMQMYVNYYNRYEKQEDENPTIGVLLCQDKDDSMVELTLPKDSNIFASKYQLYLPDKKLLQDKLGEWVKECDADKCTK